MMKRKIFVVSVFLLTVFIMPCMQNTSKYGKIYSRIIGAVSVVSELHSAKGGQGKGEGQDKEKKPKKDKGKGPSIPGIPMAAAILIGLGAIGAGRYFMKKK